MLDSLLPESPSKDSAPPPPRAEDRPTAPPPPLALELASAQASGGLSAVRSVTRAAEKGPAPDEPSVVADALAENLGWLSEERRPILFRHVLAGEYESALAMLREDRERYPRVLSIAKAVEITEGAIAAELLHEIGALSSELVVKAVAPRGTDESPRGMLLRFSRTAATLGDLLEASPLPRLRTLKIIHDLCEDESLILRTPSRTSGGLRIGSSAAFQAVKAPGEATQRPAGSGVTLSEELVAATPPSDPDRKSAEGKSAKGESADETPQPAPKRASSLRDSHGDGALPVIGAENGPPARSDGVDEAVFVFPHDPRRDPEDEPASSLRSVREVPRGKRQAGVSGSTQKPRAPSTESSGKPRQLLSDSPGTPREVLDRRAVRPGSVKLVRTQANGTGTAPLPARPSQPRDLKTWLPTILGGAAAVISAATLISVNFRAPPAAVTVIQPAATTAAAPVVVPPPAVEAPAPPPTADPATVQLSIDVNPAYAQVFLDGVPLKPPVRRSIVRSELPHELRVIAGGFKPETRRFSPTAHTSFVIALEPVQKLSDP